MPRRVDINSGLTKKWNLYVNEIEKNEYLLALVKCGKSRCQSAAVRAFMHLYVNDPIVRDKVNAIVDDFLVYKENGESSKL